LEAENAASIDDLSEDVIAEYRQELYFCLTAKGKPLTLRTQSQMLGVVKGFTRFLKESDYLSAILPKGCGCRENPSGCPG
jgi:hypothetical protein